MPQRPPMLAPFGECARFAGPDFKSPLIFLALGYLMQTTGELCLSPVGLSQMTKLAPPLLISTLMATWFLGTAGAQWVAAKIAQSAGADTIGGQVLDAGKALSTYTHVFGTIGLWGLGAGVLMLAASPWLKKLAHGASDTNSPSSNTSASVMRGGAGSAGALRSSDRGCR